MKLNRITMMAALAALALMMAPGFEAQAVTLVPGFTPPAGTSSVITPGAEVEGDVTEVEDNKAEVEDDNSEHDDSEHDD